MKALLMGFIVVLSGCTQQAAMARQKATAPKPRIALKCTEGEKTSGWITASFYGHADYYDSQGRGAYPWPAVCKDGKMVEDKEEEAIEARAREKQEAEAKAEADRKESLWNALRTRVVSDEEMAKILEYGADIVPVKDGGISASSCVGVCMYDPAKEQRERESASLVLKDALGGQFTIRLVAKRSTPQVR